MLFLIAESNDEIARPADLPDITGLTWPARRTAVTIKATDNTHRNLCACRMMASRVAMQVLASQLRVYAG